MDDIVEKTFLCGIDDDNKIIAESPISFIVTIDPKYRDDFLKCIEKVKQMDTISDMMNATLGLYLTTLYSDYYTTE